MQRDAADCRRPQSSIAIITASSTDYASYAAFYTEAIGRLIRDWSSPAITEAFIIRNQWNFREYGWIGETEFGLLAWETSA